jgi:hypothetical protein
MTAFAGLLAEPLICNDLAIRPRRGRCGFPVLSRGKCPLFGGGLVSVAYHSPLSFPTLSHLPDTSGSRGRGTFNLLSVFLVLLWTVICRAVGSGQWAVVLKFLCPRHKILSPSYLAISTDCSPLLVAQICVTNTAYLRGVGTQSPIPWIPTLLHQGVKRPKSEVYWPPSTAEVKMNGATTPRRLYGHLANVKEITCLRFSGKLSWPINLSVFWDVMHVR